MLAPVSAQAQSSTPRTVSVPFTAASQDGYVNAAMRVTYAFITCQGEMHIAYSLDEGSATAGPSYRLGGKTYPAAGAPPQPISIQFAGTVHRGPSSVGSFNDGLAGKALGMGCFSGQSQKIANIADVVGPKATAEQITAYYAGLTVQVRPGAVLRSAAQESAIRGQLRRIEAEAAAARKAEQEQQARTAARAKQEAEELARVRQAVPSQASSQRPPSASSTGAAPGGYAPPPASPPRLSEEQRIANAIASDKVLADQRLQEQRRALAQQQAALANAQQAQNQAIIANAPAIMDAGVGIYGALEAWNDGLIARSYQKSQAKLAGKCLLPNGMTAPKDGELRFGVEISAKLGNSDCGFDPDDRYKAFKLEVPQRARVKFTIRPSALLSFTSFQIDVRDLQNKSHMFLSWEEWGALQKVNDKSVVLPAGVYIVRVSNGAEGIFADFKLRVDKIGPNGQVVTSPSTAIAPAPRAVTASTATATATAAPPDAAVSPKAGRGPYLGLAVAAGERAVITSVVPGGPADAAGLRPGDQIHMITGTNSGFFGAVAKIRDQAQLDQWLATQKSSAKQSLTVLRDGAAINVSVTPGGP